MSHQQGEWKESLVADLLLMQEFQFETPSEKFRIQTAVSANSREIDQMRAPLCSVQMLLVTWYRWKVRMALVRMQYWLMVLHLSLMITWKRAVV